jgi:hypothetical protein
MDFADVHTNQRWKQWARGGKIKKEAYLVYR